MLDVYVPNYQFQLINLVALSHTVSLQIHAASTQMVLTSDLRLPASEFRKNNSDRDGSHIFAVCYSTVSQKRKVHTLTGDTVNADPRGRRVQKSIPMINKGGKYAGAK